LFEALQGGERVTEVGMGRRRIGPDGQRTLQERQRLAAAPDPVQHEAEVAQHLRVVRGGFQRAARQFGGFRDPPAAEADLAQPLQHAGVAGDGLEQAAVGPFGLHEAALALHRLGRFVQHFG